MNIGSITSISSTSMSVNTLETSFVACNQFWTDISHTHARTRTHTHTHGSDDDDDNDSSNNANADKSTKCLKSENETIMPWLHVK